MSQQDLDDYRQHQKNSAALAGAARDQLALGRSHAADALPKRSNPTTAAPRPTQAGGA